MRQADKRDRRWIGVVLLAVGLLLPLAPGAVAQLGGGIVRVPMDNPDASEPERDALLSDDGQVVALASTANLSQSATDGGLYAYDVVSGAAEQLDVKPNGASGDGTLLDSRVFDISGDGRFVLFGTLRQGLDPDVEAQPNPPYSVYVRDRQNGTTRILSLDFQGAPYDARNRSQGAISDDGSTALLIIENGFPDIADVEDGCTSTIGFRAYAVDTSDASHELLTVGSDGCAAANGAIAGDLAADGSVVVLETQATDVIPGREIDAGSQVVLRDLGTGVWEWLTEGADGNAFGPRVNANGSRVVFASDATNLVADDANFRRDVFVVDRAADRTILVSRDASGVAGPEDSGSERGVAQDISGDGRFVAFQSEARLAGPEPEGPDNPNHVFRWQEGEPLRRADVRDDGGYPDGGARSAAGVTTASTGSVLFESAARNLISGEDEGGIFLAVGTAAPADPPPPPPPPAADPQAIIDEAVAISERRFSQGGTAEQPAAYAILATAEGFADALSGAVLTQRGPMLFTRTDALPQTTADELDRLLDGSGTVYVLGGTAAVSQAVEDALTAAGYTVIRLAGNSRFETSTTIAATAREVLGDTSEVALARAFGPEGNPTAAWADSVTGGGWAAHTGTPIVLTTSDAVHPAVEAFLTADAPETVRLLGGTAALDEAVETATGGVRTAGATRSDTARQIALQLWEQAEDGERRYLVLDATAELGWGYGLAGAGLAADGDAPVLATAGTTNPPETLAAVAGCDDQVTLLALGPLGPGLLDELDAQDADPC